jgi:hypothetical protein
MPAEFLRVRLTALVQNILQGADTRLQNLLNRSLLIKEAFTVRPLESVRIDEKSLVKTLGGLTKTDLVGLRAAINRLIAVIDNDMLEDGTNLTTYLLDLFADNIQQMIPGSAVNRGTQITHVNWTYGLLADKAPQLNVNSTPHWLDQAKNCNGTNYLRVWRDYNTIGITRYGYAGIIYDPVGGTSEPQDVFSLINSMPGGFRRLPAASTLYGAQSLFCIMVKAVRRPDILTAALTGTLEDIDMFNAGDCELWQQEGIENLLSQTDEKKYRKEFYSVFRNKMKVPVKSVPNLTAALFDYKQAATGLSPIAISKEIKDRLDLVRTRIQNIDDVFHLGEGFDYLSQELKKVYV